MVYPVWRALFWVLGFALTLSLSILLSFLLVYYVPLLVSGNSSWWKGTTPLPEIVFAFLIASSLMVSWKLNDWMVRLETAMVYDLKDLLFSFRQECERVFSLDGRELPESTAFRIFLEGKRETYLLLMAFFLLWGVAMGVLVGVGLGFLGGSLGFWIYLLLLVILTLEVSQRLTPFFHSFLALRLLEKGIEKLKGYPSDPSLP